MAQKYSRADRKQILIVEDDALNMELFTILLEAEGYTIHQAGSAEQGIEIALQNPLDLILMDVALPGMDGLHAAEILKANVQTQQIPIVALTAHAMHGDQERAQAAGCAAYITKPIDTHHFVQQIEAYLLSAAACKQIAP